MSVSGRFEITAQAVCPSARQLVDRWRKQKQITAHETEYEVSHQVYALCASSGSGGGGVKQPCNRQVIRQRVICIQHEADGKIRVQQQTHRG